MGNSKLVGAILGVAGFGIAIIGGLFLAIQVSNEELSGGGAAVGAFLIFIPVAILMGFGIYLYAQGSQEQETESVVRKQRELLDILKSRGKIGIHEIAIELGADVATVQDMVHQLVGLQVFSGYVNWDEGTLYSSEASQLRALNNCNVCGGEIELVGKGVSACRFCGTEYFLS